MTTPAHEIANEIALRDDHEIVQPVNLFGTADPDEVIASATAKAKALANVVKQQQLAVRISGREHVRVEGWTLLGSMLGVFPVCVWTRKLEDGWEARVEARTLTGQIVGAAEAECLRSESTWKSRDDYALRSMAQTRATSKALRQPLGFVMTLAGFDATPLEEIPTSAPEPAPGEAAKDESPFQPPPPPGQGEFRMASGKWAGKTLREIPSDYLDWYEANGPRDDVKEAIAAFRGQSALPPLAGEDEEDIPFA